MTKMLIIILLAISFAASTPQAQPVFNQTKPNSVQPQEVLTRIEAAKVLVKVLAWDDKGRPMQVLAEKGIVNKTAKANSYLSRAEAVTMLCRAANINLNNDSAPLRFSDVSQKNWAYPYVAAAEARGWLSQYSGSFFLPAKPITRGEFSVLAANLPESKGGTALTERQKDTFGVVAVQSPKPPAQDLIALSFENMEVAQVLRLLAKESGLNIVLADNVQGKISGHLKNASPETALKNIVESAGCTYVQDNNLYRIYKTNFATKPKAPLYVREFKLNYANGETVVKELVKLIPSLEGRIILTKETNTLLINSRHPQLAMARDIIQSLDNPPLQVMVEAKIFEVSAEESSKLGTKFIGNEPGRIANKTFESFNLEPIDKAIYVRSVDRDVQAYISTLEAKADLNMLSAPKLIVVNNREATLETLEEVAYQDETVSFTTAGEVISKKLIFKNVGTKLKLVPHINEKGFISIDLYPEISSSIADTATNYPLVYTTKAHTQVVVKDGDTFLIGGLLRDKKEKITKKVPLLGDIPLLGLLFRRSEEQTVKKDIIIMITPKIINPFEENSKK